LNRRGNLLVLSAPSGTGKTTVYQKVLSDLDEIEFSISFTTRYKRPNEKDGVDYHFISDKAFRQKITDGDFLEWAEVHGHLYGTGRSETETICERGRDVLLDVDVQGADQVRRAKPDAVTIFMLPPSFEELERRLRGRKQDEIRSIEQRLENARSEIHRFKDYDYIIINDEVERAADRLRSIILAERCRARAMKSRAQSIIGSFP
jgi:guanylate kinase